MNPSIIRDFLKNKLTIDILIYEAIARLGGGLYSYMLMLEKQERTIEAQLIKSLRDEIFSIRGDFDKTKILDVLHIEHLKLEYDKFNIQLKMLKASKENAWEIEMFKSYMNEFLGLIYLLRDIKDNTL